MFTGYQNTEELARHLADAGCSEAMIQRLMTCLSRGDKKESLYQLERRRAELLGEIHKERSCIESLDRLLRSMEG